MVISILKGSFSMVGGFPIPHFSPAPCGFPSRRWQVAVSLIEGAALDILPLADEPTTAGYPRRSRAGAGAGWDQVEHQNGSMENPEMIIMIHLMIHNATICY